jgi:hypothetical protein
VDSFNRVLRASAAALSCLGFWAAAFGTFLPLADARGVQYLYVWPGARALAGAAVGIVVLLAALYFGVVTAARRWAPQQLDEALAARWLAPLRWPGIVCLGILAAVPGVGARAAPVAYLLYDLRWWWLAFAVVSTAVGVHELLARPLAPLRRRLWIRSPAVRLLVADIALFLVVTGWAVASSPPLRFGAGPHGDEPKYLRYCETWYQGGGCDISRKTLMSELPLTAASAVSTNLRLLGRAIWDDLGALPPDLWDFARHPRTFRWNRATGGNGFVLGKHGTGVYQLHQPGLSAVLFPGYFIDRHLLGLDAGYQGEFPRDLPMTNLTMLAMCGLCAVALFRLLRHATGSDLGPLLAAAVAMMTLPAAAFAFQIYPETPALLLVITVTTYAWFHASEPVEQRGRAIRSALLAGAGAGAMAWLHPRFLPVSLLLATVAMWRSQPLRRRAFAAAYLCVVGSLLAYNYHITGSAMPTALYVAGDTVSIVPSLVLDNLVGYLVHGSLGLFPHAPWLIGVTAGLAVLARRDLPAALFVVAMGLALGIPAAGHGLNPAGGTPGRFVVAVVPLMMWPAAVGAKRLWSHAIVRVTASVAIVLSLDAAWAYNWSHHKVVGVMTDQSLSGWKPNLAFPDIREYFSDPSGASVGVMAILAVLLLVSGIWAWRVSADSREPSGSSPTARTVAMVTVALVVVATAATDAKGVWTKSGYRLPEETARRRAAEAMVALDRCRVCFTSRRRQADWTFLTPNPGGTPRVDVGLDERTVTVEVVFDSDGAIEGFGRVQIDFGDGTVSPWVGVVGRSHIRHDYARGGDYRVRVSMLLRDGPRFDARTLAVR